MTGPGAFKSTPLRRCCYGLVLLTPRAYSRFKLRNALRESSRTKKKKARNGPSSTSIVWLTRGRRHTALGQYSRECIGNCDVARRRRMNIRTDRCRIAHVRQLTDIRDVLNGTPISWKSRLQRTTALSTCEAELEALFLCAKEALYLRKLVQDFGYQQKATTIFCDNKSAIIVANNPSSGKRTKHLSVKYHFLKDCLEAGFIEIKHISSEENIADIFTKPIVGEKFLGLRNKLLTEKLD